MAKKHGVIGRAVLITAVSLASFVSGAWGAMALWYQLPGNATVRTLGGMLWALAVIALAASAIARRSWLPLGAYAAMYALLLWWW